MKNRPLDNESFLIEKVRQGDVSAFKVLVDHYKNISLSLATSIVKDYALAEDILQDVFLKVFYKIKDFKGDAAFASWLYRIVVNTCYNSLKKRRASLTLSNEHALIEASDRDNSQHKLDTLDRQAYINLALTKLRADEALVLRLFYLCELRIPEIESITGFSRAKIKVDLHRGRHHLETELTKLLGDEINSLL